VWADQFLHDANMENCASNVGEVRLSSQAKTLPPGFTVATGCGGPWIAWGRELVIVGWTWCNGALVGATGVNVALYRHVTTSVCVVITQYSAARRTLWTPQRTLLRWLNTGSGGSKRRGDNLCGRKWLTRFDDDYIFTKLPKVSIVINFRGERERRIALKRNKISFLT